MDDLFVGAVIPGLILVVLYLVYTLIIASLKPDLCPKSNLEEDTSNSTPLIKDIFLSLVPPVLLILIVLGSILGGYATPTEAAGVGAVGALLLAIINKSLSKNSLIEITQSTTQVTAMVFLILIGAALFSLVFRGFGGEELIHKIFNQLPGGIIGATSLVMLIIFFLGFILDFIEITFVVVPIVGPILLAMGLDPVWLGIMIAINLQTSFLTPPFGFALFYLRGVAPESIPTSAIYKGVLPFIIIQLILMVLLAIWPGLATWLPENLYS